MTPVHRGRGGRGGRGARSGRQDTRHGKNKKKTYEPARLQESADEFEPQIDVDTLAGENEEDEDEDDLDNVSSDDDDDDEQVPLRRYDAYTALLRSFGTSAPADEEPSRKKRKLDTNGTMKQIQPGASAHKPSKKAREPTLAQDLDETVADDDEDEAMDEDEDPSDAFDAHFANPEDNKLKETLEYVSKHGWQTRKFETDTGANWSISHVGGVKNEAFTDRFPDPRTFKMKQKLATSASALLASLDSNEKALAATAFGYRDAIFAGRTVANSSRLRSVTCLHALNHIFKTRDRVLKNNAKMAKAGPDLDQEFRDQGFTRPKVLILLPTRQSCVRCIESMIDICRPEQQENKKRFEDSFVADEDMDMERPDDYKELFAGNNDDMFRIGVKFTRKTVKFFSQFYNSDLIIASPLGLRQAISGKKADADFLSSIEVLIIDQADTLLMQNWDHVLHIFEHLNQQPKEAHGCDFSRVRMWYLENHAKNLRQTILLSSHLFSQHIALLATHAHNVAGQAIFQPSYPGAILTPQSLGIRQTFLRFPSQALLTDPDARFKHFTSTILPPVVKMSKNLDGSGLGLLIYIPDSLDFPRLRNHFSFHPSCANISFGAIDENHSPADKDVRRARSHFASGRHSVLLYTERAHHFFRYRIRGVKKVVCYGLPTRPNFWEEVAGFVGAGGENAGGVRCLFSRWERFALERIVGTGRVSKMIKEKGGDVFEFV